MASLLANFFPITNISKFIPEDYYVASLLAIFQDSYIWPACLPIFSKSLHEIFRNLSPKIYYMASLLTIFHISLLIPKDYVASLLMKSMFFQFVSKKIMRPACLPFFIVTPP